MDVTKRTIEKELQEQGVYYGTTWGDSMEPLLRHQRQTVVLKPLSGRAKKHDIILVKKKNGHYVLHRVVKVLPDGYVTRGDNRVHTDAPVSESQVLARFEGYYRGASFVPVTSGKYQAYLHLWVKNPCRFVYLAFRLGFQKVFGGT